MNNNESVDNIYTIIPLPNVTIDTVDRLGGYLLSCFQFLQVGDVEYVVDVTDEEKKVLDNLILNPQISEILECFNPCSVLIRKGRNLDIDNELFLAERACDFISVSQCRFDIKEYQFSKPGILGPFAIIFYYDVEKNDYSYNMIEKHYFNKTPGIGLEISFGPLSQDTDYYPYFFSDREDEVYREIRYYLSKACRTFSIPSLQSIFSELFACLEGIGMIAASDFLNFTKEIKRVMAVNCKKQDMFNKQLDLYCLYSETYRTLVLHQGHDILEYFDRNNACRMLTDIFFQIISFGINIIETNITTFDALNEYIDDRIKQFEDHVSSVEGKAILIQDNDCNDNDLRDIFVFPITNITLDDYLELGDVTILAKGFLNSCKENRGLFSDITNFDLSEILCEECCSMNLKNNIIIYRGNCNYDYLKKPEDAWQYIDDICSMLDDYLVPLYVNYSVKRERDNFIGSVGIHEGFSRGLIINTFSDSILALNGRVYSLYNNTNHPLKIDKAEMDIDLIDIICSNRRNDEVAIACRETLITLGKAMREDNPTYSLMDIFDALDKLYPIKINIGPKWKWLGAFVMNDRSHYDSFLRERLNSISEIRKQMYHYGKNTSEVFSDENEMYEFINELKEYIITCVKKQYGTEYKDWNSLEQYKRDLMQVR